MPPPIPRCSSWAYSSLKDHGDVAPALKQEDRLVGVRGLQNFEPGFLDHVYRGHADRGFVFDDEDHLS
jgi:hypothetical protein